MDEKGSIKYSKFGNSKTSGVIGLGADNSTLIEREKK